ncbi:MAG: hypothetical protein IT170_08475 [Bryobacterales bacterium]|nr:hypothetical protein [Bryobacterales bacterium]
MVRIRGMVAVGCPHPITQRGNFRRDLSFNGEDHQTCLALLAAHAAYAMRYVEFNPVRAGMAASVLDSPWSSARVHAGLASAPEWLEHRAWAGSGPSPKGRETPGLGFRESGDRDRLREATRNGRPFGRKGFVTGLEAKLERVLEPRTCGRKPKHSDQGTEADCASASGLAASAE